MIRELRHQRIIELITQKQGITIQELRSLLKVSTITLHRDLRLLEEKGLLHRVHGGVVASRHSESQKEICEYCGKGLSSRTRLTFFFRNRGSLYLFKVFIAGWDCFAGRRD